MCNTKCKRKYQRILNLLLLITFIGTSQSCKKLVEVDPPATNPVSTSVYSNDATSAAVLTGLYSNMMTNNFGFTNGQSSISILAGLSSDELINYATTNNTLTQVYTNTFQSTNPQFWNELYKYVYVTNAAIEGLNTSKTLTAPVKKQLMGEAKFMRGFLYFYLVNLFGDVPLLTATDYRNNAVQARTATDLVYKQITTDLTEAETLLSENYIASDAVSTSTERIRPNKWAASALLARVYLYQKNWAKAEEEASKVISQSSTFTLLSDLNSVFLKNSKEAIWQLQPVISGYNTLDGNLLVLWAVDLIRTPPPAFGLNPVTMSNQLKNSFESNDARFANWVKSSTVGNQTYFYPYKYKVRAGAAGSPVTEYLTVLRLSEQYLIRAEARAQQNKLSEAQIDLNVIRNRAGLPNTSASTQSDVLDTILHERQVELFTEWGHRWFDLKRLGKINSVMNVVSSTKGSVWAPYKEFFPIPQNDLNTNPNLKQNSGY